MACDPANGKMEIAGANPLPIIPAVLQDQDLDMTRAVRDEMFMLRYKMFIRPLGRFRMCRLLWVSVKCFSS